MCSKTSGHKPQPPPLILLGDKYSQSARHNETI